MIEHDPFKFVPPECVTMFNQLGGNEHRRQRVELLENWYSSLHDAGISVIECNRDGVIRECAGAV